MSGMLLDLPRLALSSFFTSLSCFTAMSPIVFFERKTRPYLSASGAWSSQSVSRSSTLTLSYIRVGSVLMRFTHQENILSLAVHQRFSFSETLRYHLKTFHHGTRSFTPGIISNLYFFATSKNDTPVSGDFAWSAGSATSANIASSSFMESLIWSHSSEYVFFVV